jgi:hypothetical protein
MEDLEGILRKYPWFAIGYKELYDRVSTKGGEFSFDAIKRIAPYMYSTEPIVRNTKKRVISNSNGAKAEIDEQDHSVIAVGQVKQREFFVVGGDYFGLKDYQEVKESGNNIFDTFKGVSASDQEVKVQVDKSNDQFSDDEYCTETLARIYVAQGCFKRALQVYDKLILLYPEKSTYFAALKEEIKKQL